MVKFLAFAAAAFASVLGVNADAQCAPVSWVEDKATIDSVNQLLDLAAASGLLKPQLAAIDPLHITNKKLDAVPISVLGVDFTLTPTIQTLDVTGVSNIGLRHLNVSGPTSLQVGADFNGVLTVDSTLTFELAQLNHQWWQVCWTNVFKPASCPPATFTVDLGLGAKDLSLWTDVTVAMVKCAPAGPYQQGQGSTCKDLTISDIVSGAMSGNFAAVGAALLKRIKDVAINKLSIGFDALTKLNFHFHDSGPLATAIGKKLTSFTVHEINEKNVLYKAVIDITNKLGKTLINKVIQEKIKPLFGNTCV